MHARKRDQAQSIPLAKRISAVWYNLNQKKKQSILTKWITYEFYAYTETLSFLGGVVVDQSGVLRGNEFAPRSFQAAVSVFVYVSG